MAAGFSSPCFTFAGFLPHSTLKRRARLEELKSRPEVLVFFESPHRLTDSLEDMADILGPRQALMAREMTKIHEEYLYLDLVSLAQETRLNPRRGEVTIVVGPPNPGLSQKDESFNPQDILPIIEADTRPTRILASELAKTYGRSRKEMYDLVVKFRDGQKNS
jgi:16S rRNA (cytidine1402-2'-O)-methyltransferase